MLRAVRALTARQIHTTVACSAGGKWRLQRGLSEHPHEFTVLQDAPDWSFADGRPSMETRSQAKRKENMIEFTRQAVGLMEEMRSARNMHQEEVENEKQERERILSEKLKSKQTSQRQTARSRKR